MKILWKAFELITLLTHLIYIVLEQQIFTRPCVKEELSIKSIKYQTINIGPNLIYKIIKNKYIIIILNRSLELLRIESLFFVSLFDVCSNWTKKAWLLYCGSSWSVDSTLIHLLIFPLFKISIYSGDKQYTYGYNQPI